STAQIRTSLKIQPLRNGASVREPCAAVRRSRRARNSPRRRSVYRVKEVLMGFGVSLILIAVGAVLTWAVSVSTSGFNVNTVGIILMVVGGIGALLSMVFWSSWAGPGYFT